MDYFALIELGKLKEHEEVNTGYLNLLEKQIKSDKVIKKPIVADMNTFVILDGHHRLNALKRLGYKKIPVILIDYNSPNVLVHTWNNGHTIPKEHVIKVALNGRKLPPKTTKHMVVLNNNLTHISAIEEDVNINLRYLK